MKPNVKYFHVFSSMCYILAYRDPRQKFDPKSDEYIFFGYSRNNRAYHVYNKRTKSMMESINVVNDSLDVSVSTDDEDESMPSSLDVMTNVANK